MRVRLKPHVHLVALDGENVLVRGAGVFLRYSGEAVPALLRLAPLLDGTRDPAQLAAQTGLPESDVRDVLDGLRADRLVEDAEADDALAQPGRAEQVRAWSMLTHQPHRAQNALAAARVLLLGEGEVARHAADTLVGFGVTRIARAGRAADHDHVLVVADEPQPQRFAVANDEALAAGRPATYAHLDGAEAIIGPTVMPRMSACWRCYDLRALGAHPNPERFLAARALARPPVVRLPSFATVVGAWAAQAVALTVAGAGGPPLAGHVTRVEQLSLQARRHRVLRIPRCPACSQGGIPDVDRYALEPLDL